MTHPYPDDVSPNDIESAHGGRDLHELFDEVQARCCVNCETLIPASIFMCGPCTVDLRKRKHVVTVYACRRCDAWVEYAETGPHIAHHERNDAGRDRDDE